MTAPWGIEDPAAVEGTEIDKERFRDRASLPEDHNLALHRLPLKSLDEMTLRSRLSEIGQTEGCTNPHSDIA